MAAATRATDIVPEAGLPVGLTVDEAKAVAVVRIMP